MKTKKLLFLILLCTSMPVVYAQNDIQIGQITAINLGDGRLLFRELESETPLSGEHRIIDGYRSEYILADFTDGLYNGKYKYYKNTLLAEAGTYRLGVKHGIFIQYYSDGKTVKSETPLTEGKVDGIVKSYYTDGSPEREKGYKAGAEHGIERYYEFGSTEPKIDHNYDEGVMDGRQTTHVTSNLGDYFEEKYFDKGVPTGIFLQTWPDGGIKTSGQYTNGLKDGVWVEGRKDGVPENEITYRTGRRNGPGKTFFTDGTVETITNYVDDKKEGVMRRYRYGTEFPAAEYTYSDDVRNGPYKLWFEDGTLREEGRCEKGNEVYRKEYYDNGNIKRIQERTSNGWETIENDDSDRTGR